MAKLEPINNEQHKNLKVAAKRSLKHAAGQHIVPITAPEFSQGATSYPIFIVKDPESNRYRSVAMLGLETGENLFLKDELWTGIYAPQSIGMVPFSLGLDPAKEKTLTACVDVDSEYVGEDKELPLFDEKGEPTDLYKGVEESLGRLYNNEVSTERFIQELADKELLEEIELVVSLQSGEKKKIVGIYTVSEKKLQSLSDEQVLDFHKRGLFVPMHSMLGSVGQIHRLAQQRNLGDGAKVAGIQVTPVEAK